MKETTRPYRPANAAEGTSFDDNWCSRCQHDAAWREGDKGCDILRRVLAYNIGDPEYPTEWIEDDVPYWLAGIPVQDPRPRCTAFLPEGNHPVLWPRRPGRWL